MFKKGLRFISYTILFTVLSIAVIGFLFLNFSPEFGGAHSTEDKERYTASGHYNEEGFFNLVPTSLDMNVDSIWATLNDYLEGVPNQRPSRPLDILKINKEEIVNNDSLTRVTWFGHSAFLLEIDDKKILLDPMLGDVPAPHPWLGEKRYYEELPISIKDMPHIDAVFISHDHYDHLDYGSIMQLNDKVDDFFVPLGVGAHFKEWGIETERIHEMNWWEDTKYKQLDIVFTPSRHFSGRGLTDRNATLWGSWIVKGIRHTIYFSGDGGYADHFKEIGQKYGPFDLAMMECGQYNQKWGQIHMMPEQTAQAAVDVKAKLLVPIHWGAFTLALHSWTDPAIRVTKKAKELNMPITTPQIGEPIIIGRKNYPISRWWEKYDQ
ncbi:MBL fold metallo-hydrolase [Flammeovirga pacifica]|uniref:Metallo-beta-lactamase domain-containing protein n=1 Tax=Flammeovirga pacifica TaxID=915059 RepID=A0A1S1Z5D9_FLAPC|nr:MBL fold metallo-hydrolase [Flammeovirga pacifica]OHX68373.1 hypothetical protein NH26_19470 [Flammeovirga pacifica]